jgi:hypothetical protein
MVGQEHGRCQAADGVCGAVHQEPTCSRAQAGAAPRAFWGHGAHDVELPLSPAPSAHGKSSHARWLFLNCCRRGSSMRKTSRKQVQQRRTCRGHDRRATPAPRTAASAHAGSPPTTPDALGVCSCAMSHNCASGTAGPASEYACAGHATR